MLAPLGSVFSVAFSQGWRFGRGVSGVVFQRRPYDAPRAGPLAASRRPQGCFPPGASRLGVLSKALSQCAEI